THWTASTTRAGSTAARRAVSSTANDESASRMWNPVSSSGKNRDRRYLTGDPSLVSALAATRKRTTEARNSSPSPWRYTSTRKLCMRPRLAPTQPGRNVETHTLCPRSAEGCLLGTVAVGQLGPRAHLELLIDARQ